MTRRRGIISLASRVYGLTIAVAPAHVRARYAAEMRATFDSRCREAAERSALSIVALLVRECVDLVQSRRTHADQCLELSSDRRRTPVIPLLQDARYALRMLIRQPAFTLTAVVTLALGIGATTAVFTVVNGVLLRPLPYATPERLVMLLHGRPNRISQWMSPLNYIDLVSRSDILQDAAAFTPTTMNLTGEADPERVDGARVSWNYFNVLGVRMAQGRGFVAGEDRDGADVVVLSDGLWRRRFGARGAIVGSTTMLDGRPYTIVGVAPPAVRLPAAAEFWRPLVFRPMDLAPPARGAVWIMAIARLRDGVTQQRASSVIETLSRQLASEYPRTNGDTTGRTVSLHERIVRNVRPTLLMLFGAVTLVLAVACVNVANLLLARAHGRHREVAVRAALGASRRRIVAQFLTESVLLAVVGGAAGGAVAYGCIQALAALSPVSIPRLGEIMIDARVVAFALATAIATSLFFGIVPAVSVSGFSQWLAGARGSVGGGGTTLRRALVAGEIALAIVLLVGAGLLIRSYQLLQHVSPGFDPDRVTTFNVSLPENKYKDAADTARFVSTLLGRLESRPGVESASVAFGLPFANGFSAYSSFRRAGEADAAENPSAAMRIVTPEYFRTLRIPLVAGRLFDARDNADGAEVVLVNRQTVNRIFGGTNPIGQQIKIGVRLADVPSNFKTIVGIVGDVKYGGLDEETPPEVYLPYAQHAVDSFTVAVRAGLDSAALAPMLRREVASIDAELPLARLQPMTSLVDESVAERRFVMLLLVSFAAVAVSLAAIGVYGVLAYLVTQRTQEIGVRLAIGAAPGDVVRLILREGASLAAIGLMAGFAGALAAGRALAAMLFGVTPHDPATFAVVAAALGVAALAASYLPARRASKVDPMQALRAE